jgi:hypothetical protein
MVDPHHHPAAGWGTARSVVRVLEERGTPVEGVPRCS